MRTIALGAPATVPAAVASSLSGKVASHRLVACTAWDGRRGANAAPGRRADSYDTPLEDFDRPSSSYSAPVARGAGSGGGGGGGGGYQRRSNDQQQGGYQRGYGNGGGGEYGQQGQGQQQQQGGGQYRPRRNYGDGNNGGGGGGGGYGQGQGQQQQRRWYGAEDGQGGGGGGQQQQQQRYQRRDRGQATGSWDEGQQQQQRGDREGGGGGQRRQWGGNNNGGNPRQMLTPEQMAVREQVNSAIRGAQGWRELAAVLNDKGSMMDAENISTIFQRVSRSARPREAHEAGEYDQLLSTLLGWVLSMTPTFRTRHTVMNLASLAKLQLYSPEVVTALLDRAAQQVGNFSDQELTSLVSSCATLGAAPTPDFMQQLTSWTENRLQSYKIMDLVQLINGLLVLNSLPTNTTWVATALSCLEKQCLQMPEGPVKRNNRQQQQQQQQQQQPAADGQAAPAAAAEGQEAAPAPAAPPARPQGGRGQQRGGRGDWQQRDPYDLNLTEYQELVTLLANLAKDAGVQAPQSLVDAVFSRQVWRVQSPFMEFATRLLWAASNLEARPARPWFEAMMNGLAQRDLSWAPSDIGTICLYLSRYLQQPATPLFSLKLARYIEGRKVEMGGEHVASCLYLLAVSGYKPQERWLDDVLIWLKVALPTCSVQALELVYNALPFLGTGFRLNEVVTEAAARYNAAVQPAAAEQAQQEYQEPATATVA